MGVVHGGRGACLRFERSAVSVLSTHAVMQTTRTDGTSLLKLHGLLC